MTSSSFTIYKKYSFRTYLSFYRRKGDGEEDGEKDLDGYFHIGWMKSGGYPLNKKSVEALLCQELWAEWQMMADGHWPGNKQLEMSWAQQTNTAQVRLAKEKQVRGGMWNKTNVRTTEPNHHQPVGSSSTESGTLFFTQNCDMMDLMDASWCFWCKLRIPCGFGFHCMLWGAHSFTWFQPRILEQNPFTNKSGNLVVSGFSVVSTMLMQNADGAWSELLVKLDKVDSGPLAAPWPKHTIMDLFKIAKRDYRCLRPQLWSQNLMKIFINDESSCKDSTSK